MADVLLHEGYESVAEVDRALNGPSGNPGSKSRTVICTNVTLGGSLSLSEIPVS